MTDESLIAHKNCWENMKLQPLHRKYYFQAKTIIGIQSIFYPASVKTISQHFLLTFLIGERLENQLCESVAQFVVSSGIIKISFSWRNIQNRWKEILQLSLFSFYCQCTTNSDAGLSLTLDLLNILAIIAKHLNRNVSLKFRKLHHKLYRGEFN